MVQQRSLGEACTDVGPVRFLLRLKSLLVDNLAAVAIA